MGQKPASRLSFASQLEQKRLRSGTSGAMSTAIGSCGGRGGRASAMPPSARAVRPDRPLPVRPDLPDRAERLERPDRGVRVNPGVGPVRPDGDAVGAVVVGVAADVVPAMPHVSQ